MRQAVREALAGQGCSDDFINGSVLAVDEAATNVIRHGYQGRETGEFVLRILREGGTLIFQLVDFAPSVEVSSLQSRDLDEIRPGGLGIFIMKEIMDEVEYLAPAPGEGNVLQMTRRLEQPQD
jgi:sigma-B regulation protein RsbU (phosphoserine phosphatase)